MFRRLEFELRRNDEHPLAETIGSLLRLRGKDIPLNNLAFTQEQRKSLESNNYVMYALTGQTVASLRDAGHPFRSTWHKGESLETIASVPREVAINPSRLFLPDSNGKTLEEQLAMIAEFSKEISGQIPGTDAILGSVSDYSEVVFQHLAQKGQRLFGNEFGYDYTRTNTPISKSVVATVGSFPNLHVGFGLSVERMHRDECSDNLWVAPLVIPT